MIHCTHAIVSEMPRLDIDKKKKECLQNKKYQFDGKGLKLSKLSAPLPMYLVTETSYTSCPSSGSSSRLKTINRVLLIGGSVQCILKKRRALKPRVVLALEQVSLIRRKISSSLLTFVVYRATKCRLAPSTRYRNTLLASRGTCDVKLTTSESLVPSD